MTLSRRFLFYFIGIVLGGVLVYLILVRGRDFPAWMPQERVILQIDTSEIYYPKKTLCQLQCLELDTQKVHALVKDARVDFKKSEVRNKPCKTYLLKTEEPPLELHYKICDYDVELAEVKRQNSQRPCNCD